MQLTPEFMTLAGVLILTLVQILLAATASWPGVCCAPRPICSKPCQSSSPPSLWRR